MHRALYVVSASAGFVAQTVSLLYRKMPSCRIVPWPEPVNFGNVLPIDNRRYGRLTICATLNTYESSANPQPGKAALRSARFPACGFWRLSSRQVVVLSRCAADQTAFRTHRKGCCANGSVGREAGERGPKKNPEILSQLRQLLVAETRTQTGLRVKCGLSTKHYPTKRKVSDEQMAELDLLKHPILPQWNYTLLPRTNRN